MKREIHSFEQLFLVLLSDIYVYEKELTVALPELAKKAQSKNLKEALRDHLQETKLQVTRLEKIFTKLGQQPVTVDWTINMNTLLHKGIDFLTEQTASPVVDCAIIALAQRIEHFEIGTYGTLKEFADVLDYEEIKDLLKESLKEECAADEKLTKIATGGLFSSGVNVLAMKR